MNLQALRTTRKYFISIMHTYTQTPLEFFKGREESESSIDKPWCLKIFYPRKNRKLLTGAKKSDVYLKNGVTPPTKKKELRHCYSLVLYEFSCWMKIFFFFWSKNPFAIILILLPFYYHVMLNRGKCSKEE